MEKWLRVMFVGLLTVAVLQAPVIAQEEEEEDFLSGFVQQVSATSLKIQEVQGDPNSVKSFKLTSETTFENFDGIADIAIGDEIFVDYIVENGQMVATNLYIIVAGEDDDETGAYVVDEVQDVMDDSSAVMGYDDEGGYMNMDESEDMLPADAEGSE